MKTKTALGTGTVPLPSDPPPMTVWGLRIGESTTTVPITMEVGQWQGMRFVEDKRLPSGTFKVVGSFSR